MGRRATVVVFAALIVFGAGLRFWKLSGVGLWYDELWFVVGASDHSLEEMYRQWLLGDPHPPGFLLANFLWFKVVPNDELWSRLPSALAGVATLLFLLFGTKKTLSLDERLTSAAFVSLSYASIYYALTVKQYAAMMLFATVATVAYLEVVRSRRFDWGVALRFGGSFVALAWLNYFATLYVALLGGLLLLALRREQAELRRAFKAAAAVVVLCLPLVPFQVIVLQETPGDWQHDSFAALASDALPHLFFRHPRVGFMVAALVGAALVSIALRKEAREALRTERNVHLLLVAGLGLALFLSLGLFKPTFFIRYFLIVFPVTLLGFGVVVAAAFPLRSVAFALVPLVFFSEAALVEYREFDGFMRQHWDKSVDLVLANAKPSDLVVVLGWPQDKTALEYLREKNELGVYYVHNLSFYRYYFRRRGADEVAAKLEVVMPSVSSTTAFIERARGRTVWVLGGHHIKFDDDALEVLKQQAKDYEFTQLFSTRVYRATF